jgi:hypothetical protein
MRRFRPFARMTDWRGPRWLFGLGASEVVAFSSAGHLPRGWAPALRFMLHKVPKNVMILTTFKPIRITVLTGGAAMLDAPEIAVVGGGIAGSALAAVLARNGLSVVVLERDPRPVDRVRGEYMQPWGVGEAAQLELLPVLRDAGGFCIPRSIGYDETILPEDAEASPRDLRAAHPIGLGSLCAGHPAMCEALCAAAASRS